MTLLSAPTCSQHGYRHEALFYAGPVEFMAGLVPFLLDAVEHDEPTLVVLSTPKIDALRDALDGQADQVLFADMAGVGANPARIIPAWQEFVATHGAGGRRMRGIGEPIWPERSTAELAECQRHEALLNLCFADPDFWLLCPYDTDALGDAVLAEARRNHPFVSSVSGAAEPSSFPGREELAKPFDAPLPEPPADAYRAPVDTTQLPVLRTLVASYAEALGMVPDDAEDLMFVAHELATNSIRHGGGTGTLRLWREGSTIVCDVRDTGDIANPLVGRIKPDLIAESGRGLWLANQLCDLVQIRASATGAIVRVHKHLR